MNDLSKFQVFLAHSFWVICRNVSYNFAELCMETPYWCTVGPPIWSPEINKNIMIWSSLFLQKLFLFTRELAYVRINISSKTWNGYTTENQVERLFNEKAFLFFLVSRIVKTRKFKLLYFRNEVCYGNGNLYKDFFFVHLQPSVNKNS